MIGPVPGSSAPGEPTPSGASKGPVSDIDKILANVKISPRDQNILETPFGKMIARVGQGEDLETLKKEAIKFRDQVFQSLADYIKGRLKKSEEAQKKLKKALEGKEDLE